MIRAHILQFVIILFLLIAYEKISCQQVILLEQDTVYGYYPNVDITAQSTHFDLALYFENNTDDVLRIHWVREFGANCPEQWRVLASDVNITYLNDVLQSHIPIQMNPGDKHFYVTEEFYPFMMPGCCEIKMLFYEEADLDHAIDTGYYHMQINSENCQTTSVVNVSDLRVNCYPNPATSFVQFNSDVIIESVEIISLSGHSFGDFIIPSSGEVDISFLPSGIYFWKCNQQDKGIAVGRLVKL